MSRLVTVNSGILYANPDPAHRHVSAFFPNVVQLSGQELLCLHQLGDGMYAANSRIGLMRSQDGGETWVEGGLLRDAAFDDRPYSYHGTFISRMSDGTLAACPFRADRSDPEQPFFSEAGGLIANGPLLFTSHDDGRSWSGPTVMRLPDARLATPSQSIIELHDGSWMATFDEWAAFGDPGPYQPRMIGLFSEDRGRTWGDATVVADGSTEGRGFWHGRTIRLAD